MNTIEKRIKQLAESANINPVYKYDLIHCMKKIVQEQQKELIEKASQWLRNNFYHEETMCDSIAYMHEDEDVDVMIEQFKKEMEENL